jgi:GNAT superfamily N-acetyltransferase
MSEFVKYCIGRASEAEVADHLHICDVAFVPKLSSRVNIDSYAKKIFQNADRFEAWAGDKMTGLVAVYCNSPNRDLGVAFITSVSVLPGWHGRGIASRLIESCIEKVRDSNFNCICLEVDVENRIAVLLYEKHGFFKSDEAKSIQKMTLKLNK